MKKNKGEANASLAVAKESGADATTVYPPIGNPKLLLPGSAGREKKIIGPLECNRQNVCQIPFQFLFIFINGSPLSKYILWVIHQMVIWNRYVHTQIWEALYWENSWNLSVNQQSVCVLLVIYLTFILFVSLLLFILLFPMIPELAGTRLKLLLS